METTTKSGPFLYRPGAKWGRDIRETVEVGTGLVNPIPGNAVCFGFELAKAAGEATFEMKDVQTLVKFTALPLIVAQALESPLAWRKSDIRTAKIEAVVLI